MSSDCARSFIAGAIIEEEMGEMKTKRDMDNVFFHLRLLGQFWGLEGSVGVVQVMRLGGLDLDLDLGGEGLEMGVEVGDASRSWLWGSVIFWLCFGFAVIVYWYLGLGVV